MFWPSRMPVTTSLYLGGNDPTRLLLPVVTYEKRPAPQFVNPTPEPQMVGFETLDSGNVSGYGEIGTIEKTTATGTTKIQAPNTGGDQYPWGTERYSEMITHETNDAHPEKTSMVGKHRMTVELKGRTLIWEAELSFRSDLENFYYKYTRRLFENNKLIREKSWEDKIPRDFQ